MRNVHAMIALVTIFGSTLAGSAMAAPTYAPPPPATPHLRAYPDWAALWNQWGYGTPADQNPLLDTTGADCAVNQPVPGVFLLAGSFGGPAITRTCTVPVGTAFVVPILNKSFFAQQTDPPDQRTEAFVRSQVTCVEDAPSLSLVVDGTALLNPQSYLEKSTLFSVNLPPNNIFGVPAQVLSPSVDEGYYGFVEPLTPGSHVVHITSSSAACGGIAIDVTYDLTVQGTTGTPLSCSGTQNLNLSGLDIQTNGVALTVSGNCNVTISNSVLFGGTAGIVIHDQGHVVVNSSVVGGGPAAGGAAFVADGHGHGEYRNSSVISPVVVSQFAVVSDSGGNTRF
jgi:hypothetical protein